MYILQTTRKGMSSLQLSKELGITQKATWFMLHRLRTACGIEATPLNGEVEIDETYIGGRERNKHSSRKLRGGRGIVGKQPILGMRAMGGRVHAKSITDTSSTTIGKEGFAGVESGATIYTDEHAAYEQPVGRYQHQSVKHSVREFVNGMASTNGIESVWPTLKRGYNGVYHQWSAKHMRRYIDEFTFRLNEGSVTRHTMKRLESLVKGAIGKRITYAELTAE